MTIDDHPTVRTIRARMPLPTAEPAVLDADDLAALAREFGADDVGFVSIDRDEVADQRAEILAAFPATLTLVALVVRMNREPIRTPARQIANLEFHQTTDAVNDCARHFVAALADRGVRALNPAAGFPMDMTKFPGKVWVVSHKPVAVAAGLGRMGIHRNVIHPKFGNFIILGTVLLAARVNRESRPIDYNPCLSCKLCVAACPVGAIGSDGAFDFSACMTHNYREFMSGFTDWVGTVADSKNARDYNRKVTQGESASMWQSLAFGPNYKAAYCLAVCPAGEDVIAPFVQDRGRFVSETLKPLQQKVETLYVVPGSDAEQYAARKFPHKPTKAVSGIRPPTIQRGQAGDLNAVYHFTFTGAERATGTAIIRDGTLAVHTGHVGAADLRVTADSASWLAFLQKRANIVWLIVRRKVKVQGPIRLLKRFGACFPS
jgi:Fe-S-cluster-containing hydrogenase component 2